MYLRFTCVVPGPAASVGDLRRSGADGRTFARLRYTPSTSPANRRAETSAGARKLKPGLQPPAAPPPPAPPRCEPRDELKPATVFCIAVGRTQLRRPRPGSVGDLDPDGAVSGDYRNRDRFPGSGRAGVPDTVAEDLADQQDGHVSARVPGAEYLRDERPGGPRPLRSPGKRHALPDRRHPGHHRTRPSRPPRPGKQAGQRADAGICTLSSAANVKPTQRAFAGLVRGSSVVAAPVRGRP